ncbi:NACHT domain-containing protein [Luteimonas cucumeris]|uniref:NACHT domain-containing protein n=1 Tax=Luteimonas cucumeris TaxID=985012 RepID=A0A562LAF9_9GAMM|nr:NACHT domain-containing protein [Luteimonas cucumeris]TWI04662.1 NACHT domain-containing protein [Luteimonas cucumeris]
MVNDLGISDKALTLLPKGIELAKDVLNKLDQRAQYEFRIGHIEYCTNVIRKYCRSRTFFVRDEPQFIEDFYVPASIQRGSRQRVDKANLASLFKVGRRAIVTGTGGSGKTIFMRYLLLDAIERGVGYPVFIELRNINELEEVDLEKLIVGFMKEHGFPLSESLAIRSLQEGLLVILLDGFDEVVASKRKVLEAAIKKLATQHPCQIVLSSRPDMVLEGWDSFSSVRIAPLELEEACELIAKIRFDDDKEIKDRFIAKLKGGLFRTHEYFLSNPLLLSIMLLTYGDSADIPKKFASFYEQAYTALFQKHDALKSGYRRERQTSLDIYEFARLFSTFSAITYNKRAFRFSMVDAVGFAKQAQRVVGMPGISPEDFLQDARQAVCLLIEDGLDLAFVHRSFQEYFVARFINDADMSLQKQYIKQLSSKEQEPLFEVDNVLKLLHEMSPALVEENYLIPGLKDLFPSPSRKLSLAGWRRIFMQVFDRVHMHEENSLSFSVRHWRRLALLLFMNDNCVTQRQRRVKKVSEELGEFFAEDKSIRLDDVSERSPLWAELGSYPGGFCLSAFEEVRREYVSMLARSRERAKAIGDVFSFADRK